MIVNRLYFIFVKCIRMYKLFSVDYSKKFVRKSKYVDCRDYFTYFKIISLLKFFGHMQNIKLKMEDYDGLYNANKKKLNFQISF